MASGFSEDIVEHAGIEVLKDLGWSEFRRRRAEGDFADYGAEVQIADYRLRA